MNMTEAVLVNTVLRWMIGDPTASAEAAFDAAHRLSDRVVKAVSAGVRTTTITEATTDADGNLRLPRLLQAGQLPAEVASLLGSCWELEDSDGGWNGPDTVNVLCAWFTEQGVNLDHPAARAYSASPSREDSEHSWWTAEELQAFAAEHAQDEVAPPLPPCSSCDGKGVHPDDPDYCCDSCDGTGSSDPAVIRASREKHAAAVQS